MDVSLDEVVQIARRDYKTAPNPEKLKALTQLEKQLAEERQSVAEREQKAKDAEAERQTSVDIATARLNAEVEKANAERELQAAEADLDRQARAEIEAARIDAEADQAKADREQRDRQHRTAMIVEGVKTVLMFAGGILGTAIACLCNKAINERGLEEQALEFETAAKMEKDEDIIWRTTASKQRYKHKNRENPVPVKK